VPEATRQSGVPTRALHSLTFEHWFVVEGTRVPCAVLDEDRGCVQVDLRPELPNMSAMFLEE
jgi:hypothetical protein